MADDDPFPPASDKGDGEAEGEGEGRELENEGGVEQEASEEGRPAKRLRLFLGGTAQRSAVAHTQELSTDSLNSCGNPQCSKTGFQTYKAGPDGMQLYSSCGDRYREALRGCQPGEKPNDDWMVEKGKGQGNSDCGNPRCSTRGLNFTHGGPNGERLCYPCVARYRAAKKIGSGTAPNEDWREKDWTIPAANQLIPAASQSSQNPFAIFPTPTMVKSATFPTLLDMARNAWRKARGQSWDPSTSDDQPQQPRKYYWYLDRKDLSQECEDRGLGSAHHTVRQYINELQYHDAQAGVLPRPDPSGASIYHRMHQISLRQLGRDRGYFRQRGKQSEDAQSIIEFLIEQDSVTDGPPAAFKDVMDKESADIAAKILLDDLSLALGHPTTIFSTPSNDRNVPHTTHNRGIQGSYEALESLGHTLMNNDFPIQTTSRGLRCGVEALALSMESALHHIFVRDQTRESQTLVTADEMMDVLFTDYVPGENVDVGTTGTPTTEYAAYIEQTIGHLRDIDLVLYNEAYYIYVVRNNLNVQQLIAILRLLYRSGTLEDDFGLGVVVGAHRHAFDDGTVVDHMANARILHTGSNNGPVLWLHHNLAVGGNTYNHFEGFAGGGRLSSAIEWGMRIGDTRMMPRYQFRGLGSSEMESSATAGFQSTEAKLKLDAQNAQRRLTAYRREMAEACLPCRYKEARTCQRLKGKKHCNNCESDPKSCKWPEGTVEYPTVHVGATTYTDDERKEWDAPPHDIEEIFEQAKKSLPSIFPTTTTGKHFWALFSARSSSHPGMNRINQILAAMAQTQHYYDVGLNQPNPQGLLEFTRPGGPGTPMFAHLQVLCRHGNMMIPTHTGNIQDPALIAFVNLINWLLNPANPLPEEFHIVTLGIPGFQVDIDAWGDFTHGFFGYIVRHRPALAFRIHVVPLVEAHVVNGIGPESLDGPVRGAPAPHPATPAWVPYRHKFLQKLKLLALIERRHFRRQAAIINALGQGGPPAQIPAWPAARGGPAMADRLDRFLDAMYDEKALRAGWTDNTTTPTTANMFSRNNNRNLGMR